MSPTPPRNCRTVTASRSGVTAVESLLAVAIVSVAGTALLSALASAVMSSREVALSVVAQGLADQLLTEVAASPVPLGTPSPTPVPPRSNFTVVDHYDGWTESPPQDRIGRPLGTEGVLRPTPTPRPAELRADAALLARIGRTVAVEKVTPSGGGWVATDADTPFRRITVRVTFAEGDRTRTLAEASRIVCHVTPSL